MGVNWPTKSTGDKLNASDWNNARTDFITGKFYDNSGTGSNYVQASHNGTDSVVSSGTGHLRLNAPTGKEVQLEVNGTDVLGISGTLITAQQAFKATDGSAGTPGVHFTGDVDTGIGLISSKLAFVFGGTVRADNDGSTWDLKTQAVTTSGNISTSGSGIVTGAGGVKFKLSGTGSDTLSHYEEAGTWTPTYTFTTPGTFSTAYSTRYGTYKRIGKLVHAWWRITANAWILGAASGALIISGLPYASNNVGGTSNEMWVGSCVVNGLTTTISPVYGIYPIVEGASTLILFDVSTDGNGDFIDTSDSTFNVSGTLDIRGYIAYETA